MARRAEPTFRPFPFPLSLRHREIKLLYDMARTRGLLEGSQKRIRELAIQEKERELARQASSSSSPIAPLPQKAA